MKKILIMMIAAAMPGVAMADENAGLTKLINTWGGGSETHCGDHALTSDNACLGATAGCNIRGMRGSNWPGHEVYDEYAIDMLVARRISANGAYFCPVQINAAHKNNWSDSWISYVSAGDDCVWLCQQGWTGEQCTQAVNQASESKITYCDTVKLDEERYSYISRVSSHESIDGTLALFKWNIKHDCKASSKALWAKADYEEILAVSRWLPSGHGAFVQRFAVRAASKWINDETNSWPEIYPLSGGKEVLVCLNGYKPNADKTDCIPINQEACAAANKTMCDGWTECFDDPNMRPQYDTQKNCYECRCREKGYGFSSSVSRVCGACDNNRQTGVSPANGNCVTCSRNKIFDASKTENGYCAETTGYSKSDLQYGKGETKTTNPQIDKQCWTVLSPDAYKACVENGGVQ